MTNFNMKVTSFLLLIAFFQSSIAFMNVKEFVASDLMRCYDTNLRDSRRSSQNSINGQDLPLPNAIEAFISLVERYESIKTNIQPGDVARKLLQSFRIDNLDPDLEERKLRTPISNLHNDIKRAFLNIPSSIRYDFDEDDFSDDEKCALHIMLSHTINDTRIDEAAEFDESKAKQPLEVGVVNVHSKWNHAFALDRVLLGIYAAYLPTKDVDTNSILQKLQSSSAAELTNIKVNPVFAVTFGDIIVTLIANPNPKILPNGLWNDVSCPTQYRLEDNNNAFISNSELRGAVDGLIIGKKIQENQDAFKDFRLSQILRMYYGYSGLLDNERTRWCNRERTFSSLTEFTDEMLNFNVLFTIINKGLPGNQARTKIDNVNSEIRNSAFKDIETSECAITETSPDRRFTSPTNIFAIMDYSANAKLSYQTEVIGNLSKDFDIRPRGNLMGVYTNIKPIQQNTLDTIVKNTGVSGCPSCFARYYSRAVSKEEESEIIKDLNHTLTSFEEENEQLQEKYQENTKSGSPGKVVLYFNYGNPTNDYRLRDAIWDLRRYYRGVTILAIGDNKENLKYFTEDDETDVFTGIPGAEAMAKKIKQRLNKVPGEFMFKACDQSTPSKEAENKQEVYISPGKTQYWAMYPQYFLKSYGFRLKFKAQEGTQIRVCFSRSYRSIMENDRSVECLDSSGDEITFYRSDPCYRRNVHNCDPFYFSVEGKKQSPYYCSSLRCNTPKDIQFEFQHEGISCNTGSFVSISYLALLLTAIMLYVQRH